MLTGDSSLLLFRPLVHERKIMDLQLAKKTALITGGSKGIGQATAHVLAEEGCSLILVAREKATLDQTADAIRGKYQVNVTTIPADLSTEAAVVKVAKEAGAIDILVNNAGAIPPGGLLDVDNETWRRAWDLKVFGFISLTRAIYPSMAARRSGVIINIIGSAGEKFPPAYIAGATGNASLMAFTRALGRASSADGIRVVAINPAGTETDRHIMLLRDQAQRQLGDPERWRELDKKLPFGRAAHPSEIAYAAAFLASPRSGYTSGTVLTIDGGG
jgi:NAD(P)-dependent dehydrogenase (short-subunit alcohol dehydrogenase family)